MTIRGLFREFAAERLRARDERDRAMVLAWHVAALQRTEKMPELKTLLTRSAGGKQTPAQQRTVMDMMAARYGVPLKRIRLLKREIH